MCCPPGFPKKKPPSDRIGKRYTQSHRAARKTKRADGLKSDELLFSGGNSSFHLSRFPGLRLNAQKRLLTLGQWHNCSELSVYSDRFARDFHPIPYYPVKALDLTGTQTVDGCIIAHRTALFNIESYADPQQNRIPDRSLLTDIFRVC
jgi:hypothetical protein